MKYLGIDYGTKKSGIAVSDEEASFAFPKEIVSTDSLIGYLTDFAKKEPIGGIVWGLSLASNGVENDITAQVQQLAKKIEIQTSTPTFFIREDFSSVEAHRYQTKKGDRDDSAAAIILQRFLDKHKKHI
ncbi:MAG: putative pre6S rRNA nuclease [Patescibacteria group bacterium]|nr:putative pre6S rRNA nuclease [Patescibacteria group bacterium]